MKRERIILETTEGSAYSERILKDVWEYRIKKYFPHYKIISVKILEK